MLIKEAACPLSIFALDCIPEFKAKKPEYSEIPLLSKVKSDAKVIPLLEILMGDVCILPSHKFEPDPNNVCNWVSESGNYFSRGFIYKSSGKKSESVIGQKQKLKQLKKEFEETRKETQKLELDALDAPPRITKETQDADGNQTSQLFKCVTGSHLFAQVNDECLKWLSPTTSNFESRLREFLKIPSVMRRMTQIKERIKATYDLADPKQTMDDLLDKMKGSSD